MKGPLFSACIVAVSAVSAVGQAVKPASTPPAEIEVVKISTNLIRIDVSVTDAKGRPVTDLTQSEIEIFENTEKQKITSFSFVSSARDAQPLLKPVEKKPDASIPPPPVVTLRSADIRR
ncbi:MAG TPA: hypothetical protein VJ781_06560, partial [Pyrinomonadaceae bacterium]|nr:hypothetical protein [Pyrinomonadaceae bacterium]